MNNNVEKIKGYLYVVLAISALVVAFSVFSFAGSYSSSIEPSSFRSFNVSAEGKVVAVPDVAKFSFSVISEGGKDLVTLQKENTEKINKAIEFLKENGIESRDIKTSNYNISPRYQYYNCGGNYSKPCPPPEIVGYSISQVVDVKVRDFSKIGEVLKGVVEKGANNVSSLSFTIDDPEKLELEAKNIAIKKAQEQAKEIAKTANFSLGKLLSISFSSDRIPPQPMFYSSSFRDAKGGGDESVVPQVEAGSNEITASVALQYEIK